MPILISEITQNSLDEILTSRPLHFQLAVSAYGKDSRSTYLISQLRKMSRKILIGIDSIDTLTSHEREKLEKKFFSELICFDDVCAEIRGLANQSELSEANEFHVFIDVSCMSRENMGEIFSCLQELAEEITVKISIGYCLAHYIRPPDIRFPLIRRVAPINPTFSGWGAPASMPVDTIVSLGYEEGKAIGAVEYLEPRNRWVFIPHSPESRFLHDVKKHNNLLIESAYGKTIDYEVLRPADTYFQLLSLVAGLITESRPVVLPFGPKIFFAISLLVAMRTGKVSIWHVEGDDETPDASPQASGHSVILSCILSSELKETDPEYS